jgi:hypothetical protein
MKKDYKIVLVIGNGFDLDLGLKTSYKDFMESDGFRRQLEKVDEQNRMGLNIGNNLFKYLQNKKDLQKWIDIEEELLKLATKKKNESLNIATKELEYSFQILCKELSTYIKSLSYDNICMHSIALRVLMCVSQYSRTEIISFNYTDIQKTSKLVDCISCPVEYVHGQVSNDSIILGFQDEVEIDKSFCFMIKSFSPFFRSHNVRRKLLEADEIIFFGHSFGSTDYHYFEDLFKFQSDPDKANPDLILRIFTYNEKSRRDILFHLREMNDRRTDMLFELCDFEIYRTGLNEGDDAKMDKYFAELAERIEKFEGRTQTPIIYPR